MSCEINNSCSNPIKVPKKIRKVVCNRKTVQIGTAVKLKMLFTDEHGVPIDPAGATVTLVDPAGNDIDPGLQIVKIDVGYWYFSYTPNVTGQWKDKWTVSLLGENITFEGDFAVTSGGTIIQPICGLEFNSLIKIELKDLKDTDGNLLAANKTLFFTTEYDPLYASVEMLKMEMGSWVQNVPDDTIALSIHWSSLEANNITGVKPTSERYYFARTRFVMYDAALRLFSMPVGNYGDGGKQKQLGDLLISDKATVDFNLKDLLAELKAERDEWWRVVNAGGCIVSGQGLGPGYAEKGNSRKGFKRSREWHNPLQQGYLQPTQNSQYRAKGESKYKHGFTPLNTTNLTSFKKD